MKYCKDDKTCRKYFKNVDLIKNMYILEHSGTWNIWDHVLLGLFVFCSICLFDIRNSYVRLQYNEEVYVHPIKNGFGRF